MPDSKILIVEDEAIEALDIQSNLVEMGYPMPDVLSTGGRMLSGKPGKYVPT